MGPTFRVPEGAEPYPVTMNRGAVAEMPAIDPAAVVVKGDLTSDGHDRASTRPSWTPTGVLRRAPAPRPGQPRRLPRGHRSPSEAPFVGRPARACAWRVIDTIDPGRASGRVSPATLGLARRPGRVAPTGRCWSSATTTCGAPSRATDPTTTSASIPTTASAWSTLVARRPTIARLLRRPHPPQPGAALRGHRRRSLGGGGVREGLPGELGRVPRLRGRHRSRSTAASRPRGPGLDRADPAHVRRHLRRLRLGRTRGPLLRHRWSTRPLGAQPTPSGVQALVDDLDPGPAVALGPVHGGIGGADHRLGLGRRVVGQHQPDAGLHHHLGLGVVDPDGLRPRPGGSRPEHAIGQLAGLAAALHVLAQHDELVAAEAGHRVTRPQRA